MRVLVNAKFVMKAGVVCKNESKQVRLCSEPGLPGLLHVVEGKSRGWQARFCLQGQVQFV